MTRRMAQAYQGGYRRNPDCSLGIGSHTVEIFYSERFWKAVPVSPRKQLVFFDVVAYLVQQQVFSREVRKMDGDFTDPCNSVHFYKFGIVRSKFVKLAPGVLSVILYSGDGQFHANVDLFV